MSQRFVYLFLSEIRKINCIDLVHTVMEHRPLFHTSPMFETVLGTNHDQSRNHIQSSVHLGSTGVAEGASFTFHMENMLPGNHPSNWNFSLRSNGYVPSSIITEPTYPQVPIIGPSYHPFQLPSAARSFFPIAQDYSDCPSSSSQHSASTFDHYGPLAHGYEEGNTSSTGRGPYKRKRTATSLAHEGVGGYYSVGSSSDGSVSSLEKPNTGSQHWPWEVVSVTSSSRGSGLSVAGEALQRNVRSRSAVDLDVNRAHALSNLPCYSHTAGRLMDHSTVNVANPIAADARGWNHFPGPSNDLARILAGRSASSHDTPFRLGSGGSTSSLEIDSYRSNFISSRNPVTPPQNMHFSGSQAVRGGRSSYVQRAIPVCRVRRGYQRVGHVAASSERVLQPVPESYPSSYSRTPSMIGLRNGGDRSGRLRIPYQRTSSLSVAADSHDRLGFMMVDHSTLYDSRTLLDQHRDMRLDVDNMSYEELLALEERIGSVNTGLSEDSMSKCLKERIHYLSDQSEEDSSCAICLEEYSSKEVVATLANCGHDYHSNCIKKWLSIKKVCPICKAAVLSDN